VEVVLTNAQIEAGGANGNGQRTHSTLPGFMMPFGSRRAFQFAHDGEFHGIAAARDSAASGARCRVRR